jgi:ankyrin repeat protein
MQIMPKSYLNRTPLHVAAEKGHEGIVRLLIQNGENIEARDGFNQTPLWLAAKKGHEGIVRLLIQNGANIEATGSLNGTPLWLAAKKGHESIVRLLIQNEANTEARDGFNQTPLHVAAEEGYESIVRLLIQNEANTEARDDLNHTPLHVAAEKGHEGIVRLLIQNEANIEARDGFNQTPLYLAVKERQVALAGFLLQQGANPNVEDKKGSLLPNWVIQTKELDVYSTVLMIRALIETISTLDPDDPKVKNYLLQKMLSGLATYGLNNYADYMMIGCCMLYGAQLALLEKQTRAIIEPIWNRFKGYALMLITDPLYNFNQRQENILGHNSRNEISALTLPTRTKEKILDWIYLIQIADTELGVKKSNPAVILIMLLGITESPIEATPAAPSAENTIASTFPWRRLPQEIQALILHYLGVPRSIGYNTFNITAGLKLRRQQASEVDQNHSEATTCFRPT